MTVRSDRQLAYLENARRVTSAQFSLERFADFQDFYVLRELNYCVRVASDMFLGGEFGINPGMSLEDYIKNNRETDDEIKKLKRRVADLLELVEQGGPGQGGNK